MAEKELQEDTPPSSHDDKQEQSQKSDVKKAPDPGSPTERAPKKPSTLTRLWTKSGITVPFLILSSKAALPPIICLAAYQSTAWADKYTTLGYLSAIMSMLSLALQPRAKFLQSILVSILFTCFGAAFALLEIQCIVAARMATTPALTPQEVAKLQTGESSVKTAPYNASASAVAALFLFVTVFFANTIRAARPQLQLPVIQYSIFTVVASSYSPGFPNMTAGMAFVKRLLETFLTGFGIAAGVSLFLIPMTSRGIVAKQFAGMFGLLKASIGAQGQYMQSMSRQNQDKLGDLSERHDANQDAVVGRQYEEIHAETKVLRDLIHKLGQLFGKIVLEVDFAKKEVAYGKLHGHHYTEIKDMSRDILLPIFGLSTFIDIMGTARDMKTEKRNLFDDETVEAIRHLESDEWDEVIELSQPAYKEVKMAMLGGLTHITQVLEFTKPPKKSPKDVEKAESHPKPGEPGFTAFLEQAIERFHERRQQIVRTWAEHKGIDLPHGFWDEIHDSRTKSKEELAEIMKEKLNQQQLYVILYLGYLVWQLGRSILAMAKWADSKVADGTMQKRRLILPNWKKFFMQIFANVDTANATIDSENAGTSVYFGDAFTKQKDPEHLPPTNIYEKATNYVRAIPRFFASDAVAFGFRTAVATMSIAILAYLEQTHLFYLQKRVLWATIMIVISMSANAGAGIFGFLTRLAGTVIAMIASYVLWYIADQKPAAMLPLFYIYLCGGFLFLLTHPQLVIAAIISMVTVILIVGYELQERKIGLKLAISNGQPYYQVYILAPYRLLTVIAGLTVNFIFTYWPYPVTTHATLRKDLGATLYLLGNFYSCMHTTVELRMRLGVPENPNDPNAPITRLNKARQKVFEKCIMMLGRLREHSHFARFEPPFGGRFPRQKYDELIESMQHMFNYIALISYSSRTFASEPEAEESAWLKDFRKFTGDFSLTSHQVTSTLCLVSASMRNKQPLPPYLGGLKGYALPERMESVDPDLLSVKHVTEPCYAAFAVLEIASNMIIEEMNFIVRRVKELVGEVDFSFHVVSTNDDNRSSSTLLASAKDQKHD